MAALLEKMPPEYTLATCPEKSPDDTIKVRPVIPQKPEDITSKMPADWRQQLLRHIEAKRLDRVRQGKADTTRREMHSHSHTLTVAHWEDLPVCICVSLYCKVKQIGVQLHVSTPHCRSVSLTYCTLYCGYVHVLQNNTAKP